MLLFSLDPCLTSNGAIGGLFLYLDPANASPGALEGPCTYLDPSLVSFRASDVPCPCINTPKDPEGTLICHCSYLDLLLAFLWAIEDLCSYLKPSRLILGPLRALFISRSIITISWRLGSSLSLFESILEVPCPHLDQLLASVGDLYGPCPYLNASKASSTALQGFLVALETTCS